MAQEQGNPMNFIASEAVAAHLLVKLGATGTPPYVGLCGAGEKPVGVNTATAVASGGQIAVQSLRKAGTIKMVAAAAIAYGAKVYSAASGCISSTAAGDSLGTCLEEATAAGDIIEVLPDAALIDYGDIENTYVVEDDFLEGIDTTATTGRYVAAGDTSGANTVLDAAGGVMSVTTDVTNNDQWNVSSINETFLIAASKPMVFEARVKIVEGATNKCACFIGLSDTVSADHLVDTTGAIRSSFDGFGFYKSSGDNLWRVVSSNATTQTAASAAVTSTSGTWFKLKVTVEHTSSTTATLKFYIDGVLVATHTILYASLEEMHFLASVKVAGGAGSVGERMDVDYWRVVATR